MGAGSGSGVGAGPDSGVGTGSGSGVVAGSGSGVGAGSGVGSGVGAEDSPVFTQRVEAKKMNRRQAAPSNVWVTPRRQARQIQYDRASMHSMRANVIKGDESSMGRFHIPRVGLG